MIYTAFKKIESDTLIAAFFNHVMKGLKMQRMFCAPDSFRGDKKIAKFKDEKFCDLCRYELWMHGVTERLEKWQKVLEEYFTEFHGNWKYYAAYHRLSAIREFGADERDLDEEGNVRREGLTDRDLMHYTVLLELYDEGWRDIVQDTTVNDIKNLSADIVACSSLNLLGGLQKHFGNNIFPAVMQEDGEMRKITMEEYDIRKASEKVTAEYDAKRVMAIAQGLQYEIDIFKRCEYNKDNKELLLMATEITKELLNLDFSALETAEKKYEEKFVTASKEKGE